MDIHQNARLTPHGRAELVRRVLVMGQAARAVAMDLGVNVKTVNKWCARFQAEGAAGLLDRSSRPHRLRHTYGTELAAAGIDLLVLRELMGHASPETTARYVHLSSDTLAAEFAAARAATGR